MALQKDWSGRRGRDGDPALSPFGSYPTAIRLGLYYWRGVPRRSVTSGNLLGNFGVPIRQREWSSPPGPLMAGEVPFATGKTNLLTLGALPRESDLLRASPAVVKNVKRGLASPSGNWLELDAEGATGTGHHQTPAPAC